MPPKKKTEEVVIGPWMLGRWSRALKVGLVGMPNVGKSTLYNSLSKSHHSKAANVPFCTIDPTETRAYVEDPRFDWMVQQYKPKSEVKAFVQVVDIAGLVSGASNGEGLGNAFLSHISAVDGLIHVMRAFEDDDIIHAEDTVDPVRDIETICNELRIKDISSMKSKKEMHGKAKQGAKAKSPAHAKKWEDESACIEKIIAWLESGKDIKQGMDQWSTDDIEYLNDYMLLTAKPVMFAINLNHRDYCRKKNKFLKPIFEWVNKNSPGSTMIPYCGSYESELQDMSPEEAAETLKKDETTSAMAKMISTAFHMVHLINFYTAGEDEVKAWTIRKGFKAPQAAGVIHTDFEKNFICAECMTFDILKELGSESEVKGAGKYRQEGKTYEVQDGDVIFFKFGRGK
jgi:obg-like ATPase 1